MNKKLVCDLSVDHKEFFQTEQKVSYAEPIENGQVIQFDKMERVWICADCMSRARLTQYYTNKT